MRWFEFLLEPDRLRQHLENSSDPSPLGPLSDELTDLIKVDSQLDPEEIHIPPDSYEAKYRSKKAYALQTLAIKIASFLKWDLNVICNNLTIPVQYKLIQSLTSACSLENCPPEVQKYADIVYWHWFLRSAITYQLSTLQPQTNNTTIIYLSQLQQQQHAADASALASMSELFATASKELKSCSTELHTYIWDLTHDKDNSAKRLKGSEHPFKKAKLSRPTIDCFNFRDGLLNDWSKCESIDTQEVLEAACYDLGRFFFFQESYELAKHTFEIIQESHDRFPKLSEYLKSATDLLGKEQNGLAKTGENNDGSEDFNVANAANKRRKHTENYCINLMIQYSKNQKKDPHIEVEEGEIDDEDEAEEDSDLRFEQQNPRRLPENSAWHQQVPDHIQQQQLLEATKGDVFMSQGNFSQAMGCFVGTLMLMTDYFRTFSKNYVDEEPYISRMIQCSISLSCFTQAVALCQMTRSLNYTIAFKQLNERVCNDCCDDIYECIWNVTLLEYIINLHSRRGEIERRTRVIQLIGQLELNENNPEEILKEAEHVRRGRFFRILSNKYL